MAQRSGVGKDRLLKLRHWLTVTEAAAHLSALVKERLSEADLLRFAAHGHLRLSVNLVNGSLARCGAIRRTDEVPADSTSSDVEQPRTGGSCQSLLSAADGNLIGAEVWPMFKFLKPGEKPTPAPRYFVLQNGDVLELTNHIVEISGVWDLPMIGAEQIDVENAYQSASGGPEVMLYDEKGAFVLGPHGEICQLLDQPSPKLLAPGAAHEEVEAQRRRSTSYFPAYGLPDDSVLVVRTAALADLEQSLLRDEDAIDNPLGQRERRTLLSIIAALADAAGIPVNHPSKAGAIIERLTTKHGAKVSARAVESHLKRIPHIVGRPEE